MNELDGIENPFRDAIVRDAWSFAKVDVPEINRRAFDVCANAFSQVVKGKGSASVLLHGSTGSGKTHLLSRLQNQLVTGAVPQCIFASVKLQTSPDMLWQHLRRRLADDLLREIRETTQLQRLAAHYLAQRDPERQSPGAWERRLRVLATSGAEHTSEVDEMLDQVAETAALSFDVRTILGHLVFRRHRPEARAWLRGDSLPEEALARLGLSAPADADPEDQARDVILGLCRLSEPSLPMVLCFDQVEALQAHTGDRSAFFRLGGMLATLFEADDTLLLLTCVQSAMLYEFKDAIREADWVRLARTETSLEPLWPDQAYLLLERRLDAAPALAALRRAHPRHPLWPLSPSEIDPLLDRAATARRVLSHGEQLFDRLRTEKARAPREERAFLAEELAARRSEAQGRLEPSQTEATLRHGLPLLLDLLEPSWRVDTESGEREAVTLKGERASVEAYVLNQDSMTSLASKLRRLLRSKKPGRVILRDPRLPIRRTAKQARKYLDELLGAGVRLLEPDLEVLAALEAMRTLLSDARAGDLANDGAPVSAPAVRDWLAGQLEALRLRSFLTEVLSGGATPVLGLENEVADALRDRPILAIDALAATLSRTPEELSATISAHPSRFGLLHGPPAVVFEFVLADEVEP